MAPDAAEIPIRLLSHKQDGLYPQRIGEAAECGDRRQAVWDMQPRNAHCRATISPDELTITIHHHPWSSDRLTRRLAHRQRHRAKMLRLTITSSLPQVPVPSWHGVGRRVFLRRALISSPSLAPRAGRTARQTHGGDTASQPPFVLLPRTAPRIVLHDALDQHVPANIRTAALDHDAVDNIRTTATPWHLLPRGPGSACLR